MLCVYCYFWVRACSGSEPEYIRFLDIAFGSLRELHYQFKVVSRLQYVHDPESEALELKLIETEKVLGAIIRSLCKH